MERADWGYTLQETLLFEGVGLHTGERCKVALHPASAAPPSGACQILIRKGDTAFPARWEFVVDTTRATVLGEGGARLGTVEHLMAALWMTGITHCVIEVLQGNEVPILDGSALPFVEAIHSARAHFSSGASQAGDRQAATSAALPPRRARFLQVRDADRYLALEFDGGMLTGYIQFAPPLGVQAGAFPTETVLTEIAPARTFGFLHEVEALRRQGLAQGGTLENALVIGESGYYNPARFVDEPLRHKLLDVLGDLYLSGVYLPRFTLVAVKPGHALNVALARALAQCFQAED